LDCLDEIATNEKGFMQGWNFITSIPEPLPIKINKVEVNNKSTAMNVL
jgi:hypothetical protein